ncbi:MAG TPA: NrfD/PsrC family molybdoenzyme membrane anchor subunit [Candidatus Acidoferrales bacterium]|nr:NrfD/PsrC family molybdoenzyme membrane anchor subunit [Candidatus Acidoferrales bacterium]
MWKSTFWSRLTPWHWILGILMLGGASSAYIQLVYGLGKGTHLSDQFPWGLWVGLNAFCGIGLAVGGFTLAFVVHLSNLTRYRPVLRATLLVAFLGYLVALLALVFQLGRPATLLPLLGGWNPYSILVGSVWCILLYIVVLALAFAPNVGRRLGWQLSHDWPGLLSVPLLLAAVILSLLHQHSLLGVFTFVPEKQHVLWHTALLPVFCFLASVSGCLAVVLFSSWHSGRAFGKQLELPVQTAMGRVLGGLLCFYLVVRVLDLGLRGEFSTLLKNRLETNLLGLEISLFLLPALLLFRPYVLKEPAWLYACSVLVIGGFVTYNLNVSITAVEAGAGMRYWPSWAEVFFSYGLIALGFVAFRFVAKRTPIFGYGTAGGP